MKYLEALNETICTRFYQYLDNHKSLLVFMLFISSIHIGNDLSSIQYFNSGRSSELIER